MKDCSATAALASSIIIKIRLPKMIYGRIERLLDFAVSFTGGTNTLALERGVDGGVLVTVAGAVEAGWGTWGQLRGVVMEAAAPVSAGAREGGTAIVGGRSGVGVYPLAGDPAGVITAVGRAIGPDVVITCVGAECSAASWQARSKAVAKARTLAKRSFGSLASAVSTTSSTAGA